jgi:peptide/nickel transport system permease protein
VRGQALSGRRRDYVDAARALGASDWRIMARHILPNTGSIVLTVAGFDVAGTILAEASISVLGFGIQPPTASWGNMLTNSLEYVSRAWWLVAGPGVAIGLTVLSVFLLADGLRDALDPRLSR